MSSAAKVKRLVKPILARNPDLVLIGKDTLWLCPIHKFGRHLHFRRTRSDYFTLSWHLSALFAPALWTAPDPGCFFDKIGRSRLRPSNDQTRPRPAELHRTEPVIGATGTGLWEYDDQSLQEDLIVQVEEKLRLMRSLDILETCIAFLRSYSIERMCQIEHWPMILDLAAGDLDAARETWVDVRQRHRADLRGEPVTFLERIEHRWSELDRPLMERDKSGLAALLNRWEFENVRAIGVQNLWRPTAFPFEIHT